MTKEASAMDQLLSWSFCRRFLCSLPTVPPACAMPPYAVFGAPSMSFYDAFRFVHAKLSV
jgi:hypothetical protein